MLTNLQKFALIQFRQAAHLDEILRAMEAPLDYWNKDKAMVIKINQKHREEWLNANGLTMSNEERILWNDLLLKNNSNDERNEFDKEVDNEKV